MDIAFPVRSADAGLQSEVFNHFGTASRFIVVNDETKHMEILENQDLNHAHGQCQPLAALGGRSVDTVVVGGIGGGALNKLLNSGIAVYRAQKGTVQENLDSLKAGRLEAFSPQDTCQGHSIGGGVHDCSHG